MKANEAPEKIHLRHNHKGDIGAGWLVFPLTDNDIEYVRADTLELKEVDLENIAAVEWDNSIRKINGDPDNAYFLINRNDYIELTKHLFKLILKAQKGE